MQWASTASTAPELAAAIREAASAIRAQLDGTPPDLLIVFVSAHHADQFARLPALLAAELGSAQQLGCSAGAVIGGGREIEDQPGLSLTAAVLPGVDAVLFHIDAEASLPGVEDAPAWARLLGVPATAEPHFLLLPEPFSFDPDPFIQGLDRAYPGSRVIGGLASGARAPGGNALFRNGELHRSGVVGVALSGNISVDTVVAQGCRPIGQPMFVTKCERNVIWSLDGHPAIEVLQELYERLPRADQDLARHSLFLGIVMREHQHEYRQGDFLIRNLAGMDPARGAIAIGALVQENAVVQFHLRDAHTSADDLDQLLGRYAPSRDAAPQGALLFSCLGRGSHLYGEADHDSNAFRRHLGAVPLGGFFCNGEIGPVHGSTFLHGYTSSFGLFRPRSG